ncbi:hypothetical protein N7513_003282 [Penicillium frequentans]|uniref:Uncharacterized protein n=1 Tax=Penicillium frequentans TaxID=3151616 RepID=A0AAD6CHQ0_9EURO|nr:hypothetical protein N7494_013162 [Penicillium glabrum]KAJ5557696.1 hypothetical protein N7513_003282 [Penicillium glabrum]
MWQVLEGIRFLRDRRRVLAVLSADTILFTESGGVRIAGVEHSCKVSLAEMYAAMSELFALAEVVTKLMKKNLPPHQWSAEIASLPDRLKSKSIEELPQVSLAFLSLVFTTDQTEQHLWGATTATKN